MTNFYKFVQQQRKPLFKDLIEKTQKRLIQYSLYPEYKKPQQA